MEFCGIWLVYMLLQTNVQMCVEEFPICQKEIQEYCEGVVQPRVIIFKPEDLTKVVGAFDFYD